MIRNFFLSIGLLLSISLFSQNNNASPYSFYGIGDVKLKGTIDNRSMGGVGIFPDSIHINFQNPAAFASIKLTSLTFAGNYTKTKINSSNNSENSTTGQVDYIAVAVPMGKFGASFGLMPYTAVGYNFQNLNPDNTQIKSAEGSGGVNKAYLGFAYQINKNWSVGINFDYNFGNITTSKTQYIANVQYGTREFNSSKLFGLNINTGLMYNKKIDKKHSVYGSFTFNPGSNLTASNNRRADILDQAGNIVDQKIFTVPRETIKLPFQTSVGVGYGDAKKWLVGAEFTSQKLNSFSNIFNDVTAASFENANKIAIGGYFTPKYNSFNSYFERMTYRAGLRYENTGLVLRNQSIKDKAVTLGIGLPLQGFSNINIGVELGQRGTTKAGLIEENYANFMISLSFADRWFIKRKYD